MDVSDSLLVLVVEVLEVELLVVLGPELVLSVVGLVLDADVLVLESVDTELVDAVVAVLALLLVVERVVLDESVVELLFEEAVLDDVLVVVGPIEGAITVSNSSITKL
mmetsp:Transcript_29944/g.65998  ORF Transcript_29944/g.65998 Transcript_29944/m.65998 type:complete len:108 (+) Transcript_29944:1244-1567(+)